MIKINKENQTEEIHRSIRLGWAAFGKLSYIIKNQNIPLELRSKVYNQFILPVLTYGAQTWALTKANVDKCVKTQRAMERQMLNIKLIDRKKIQWIRQKTKVIDIAKQVASLKWRFCDHTMRQKDNRWNKKIQLWRPWEAKRIRGRPQHRWADDIKKVAGIGWKNNEDR